MTEFYFRNGNQEKMLTGLIIHNFVEVSAKLLFIPGVSMIDPTT
jgi:hypothetical protein